jgi:hypothetical protein
LLRKKSLNRIVTDTTSLRLSEDSIIKSVWICRAILSKTKSESKNFIVL